MSELNNLALEILENGKGILAADESTATMTKRLNGNSVPSTPENRLLFRETLFSSSSMTDCIGGVILYDETIKQISSEREKIPELISSMGAHPGIKVDTGAKALIGSPDEKITEGLNGLKERLEEYNNLGAKFTKWSQNAIDEHIKDLFIAFDEDKSGQIDVVELGKALQKLSAEDHVDEDDVSDLFHMVDADCNGLIDYDEFYLMMTAGGHSETRRRMSLIHDARLLHAPDTEAEKRKMPIDQQLGVSRMQANVLAHGQNAELNADLAELGTPREEEESEDEEEEEMEEDDVHGEDAEVEDMDDGEDPMEDLVAQCKILASHFQVLATFKFSINVQWPPIFAKICSFLDLFNFNIVGMLGLDCIGHISFYTVLVNTFLLPIVAVALLGLVILLMTLFAEAGNTTGQPLDYSDDESQDPKCFGWKKIMLLLFFIYPGTTQTNFSQFNCMEVEGQHYLAADLSLKCYDENWVFHALVAICGLLLYTVGIPAWVYTLLVKNRHKLYCSDKFRHRFSFVYIRFEHQYYYYELVEMSRKVFLGGLVMFIARGTMFQVVVATLFAVIFLVLHIKLQPFREDIDDDIQTVALTSSFLTLMGAIMLMAKEEGGITFLFILIINILTMIFGLWAIIFDTLPSVYEEYEIKFNEAMAALDALKSKMEAAAARAAARMEYEAMQAAGAMGDMAGAMGDMGAAATAGVAAGVTGAMGGGVGSAEDGNSLSKAEYLKASEQLFTRYDLDGSETLNSNEELEQLTYNLAFKLKLGIETEKMDSILSTVELSNSNAWNLAEFQDWFASKLLDGIKLE
jgi:hypothetical protein